MSTVEPALYAAQGGGLAIIKDGRYVWHSDIPEFLNAQEGDPIPEEWSVVAINDAAHREERHHLDRRDAGDYDDFLWD